MRLSGETRLAAVIGWPVRHSRSPAIHNAAFAAAGLDWAFLALPVAPGAVAGAIAGMRHLGIEGLSVTMPHKAAVAAMVDQLSADAVALGAVNCVARDGDALVGHNTDGSGFVASLRDSGADPGGMRCVVVGAGGAARAVVRALAGAGATWIGVHNRSPGRAEEAALLAGPAGAVAGTADLAGADLVVNATPVGMGDDDGLPFDPAGCAAHAVVADLVYHPEVTPLLAAADRAGLRTVGGLGMLVHQAAGAFRLWTGQEPPIEAMAVAARASR